MKACTQIQKYNAIDVTFWTLKSVLFWQYGEVDLMDLKKNQIKSRLVQTHPGFGFEKKSNPNPPRWQCGFKSNRC